MFALLKKLVTGKPDWNVLLGWQVITYEEGGRWLSLPVEPMLHGPCRVYVPDAAQWAAEAPDWARDRRDEILQRMQGRAWNRDLAWTPSGNGFWPHHVDRPWDRSLEGTPGGRQLLSFRLFDIDNPGRISKADAKRAWCQATEQMCLQLDGGIDLHAPDVVPGSVFQEVAIPALQRNPRAQLRWADAA